MKTVKELLLAKETSELMSRRHHVIYEQGSDPLIEMTLSEWWDSIPERDEPAPISGEIEIKEDE